MELPRSNILADPDWLVARLPNATVRQFIVLSGTLPVLSISIWLMDRYLIAEGAITLAAFPISLSLVGALYLGSSVAVALAVTLFYTFSQVFDLSVGSAAAYAALYGVVIAVSAVGLRALRIGNLASRPVQSVLSWYAVAGLAAPVITTLLGVPLLAWAGGVDTGSSFPVLLISNYISDSFSPISLGLAICTIIDWAIASGRTAEAQKISRIGYEKLFWFTLVGSVVLAVTPFGDAWTTHGVMTVSPALYLLLAWSALRFSMPFTMTATALAGLYITSCLAFGLGGTTIPSTTEDFLMVYADLLAMTILAQITSAMTRQRWLDNNRALAAELDRARLKRYFSPHIVDELLASSDAIDKTHAQKAVVLFTDIVGFTSISEKQTPEETIAMLRQFDTAMEAEIFDNSGVVDKYLGDGVMAAFGLPKSGQAEVTAALRCALGMVERIQELSQARRQSGLDPYDIGIGLHYGNVVAGHVGSERNLSFTVIGDTVNTASRLESLTRELDAHIVISQAVVEAIQTESGEPSPQILASFVPAGKKLVKGRKNAVEVWMLPRSLDKASLQSTEA